MGRMYDEIRHEWRYDIGGQAWNNTELLPGLLALVQFPPHRPRGLFTGWPRP